VKNLPIVKGATSTHAWLGIVVGNTENDDMCFGGKVSRKINKEEASWENVENDKKNGHPNISEVG
jgi:hypothetical protein